MKNVMFVTCCNLEMFWLSTRQTLQNGAESVDIVSSESNSPDSTAVTRSLSDLAAAL